MTSKTIASVGLALILSALTVNTVEASTHQTTDYDRHDPRGFGARQTVSLKVAGFKQIKRKHERKHERRYREKPRIPKNYAARTKVNSSTATRIVAHPPGCPSRAFCGCGTSLHIFGKNIREAWLARWWFRFPVSTPGPGKVAVRRHHVFAILRDLGGGRVLAYDPNSGGHKTRIHVRSLAGYSVRDPRGRTRYASVR